MISISGADSRAIDERKLEQAVEAVFRNQGVSPEPDVSIVFVDDEQMRELNKRYRQEDSSTDVLSFGLDEPDQESGNSYLGDIVLSLPRVRSQAGEAGHPLMSEVLLLVVHGTLHLLGYDDEEPENRRHMFSLQKEILTELGVPIARWPEV
jgi:probable rRNA maturation factor